MSRKRESFQEPARRSAGGLAERLADELKSGKESGQPMVYEKEFPTGKLRVNVIWDAWDRLSLEERTGVILRAYELVEGRDYRDRIALASGLTVPEAYAAGMLPYQVITALRQGDPLTFEDARKATLEEGASMLVNPNALQLRFPTQEEAKACVERLVRRFPGSEPVWMIQPEMMLPEFAAVQDAAEADEQ